MLRAVASVDRRSSIACGTESQMPVTISTVLRNSSLCTCGLFSPSSSITSAASLLTSRVSASTSANSHSTPRVGRGEPAKSMWLLAGADNTARHALSGVAGGQGGFVWRRLAGWLVWPAFWKCAPAELKSPGAPPVGATELASHFPTEWMCRPWKPGVNWPGAVVSTVTVAKPPANSMSAVATVVPLASFSWAVSFSPLAAWFSPVWPCPSVGDAEGDGEPVQTDGVVPGEVATCSGALHALKATTGTAKTATTETGLSMCKSLTGDRHDHARRLLGQLGDPRLHGRLEQLADLVGGFVLARRVAEEHRGARDLRQAQVAGLGHVPAGVPQPIRGAFGDTFDRRDVVHTHVGLSGRRGRGRRCRTRGADGCGGDRRRLIVVRVAGAHGLEPDQQKHHAQEQQHHDHGT